MPPRQSPADPSDPPATSGPPDSSEPPTIVRPPLQERSRRTLDRISRAALDLFAGQGVARTSVQDIVDRADSSVGSFYARFEGKDALVRYLETRVWEEARERWDEAVEGRGWEDLSLEALVEGVVELLVRLHREDAGRRAALRAAGASGGSGAAGGSDGSEDPAGAFHAHVAGELTRLILAHRARLGHPEPERAAVLGYRIVVAALRELLDGRAASTDGPDPPSDTSSDASSEPVSDPASEPASDPASAPGSDADPAPDTLARELARCWLGYLGAEPYGRRGPEGEVDFFDVWG